MLTKISPSPNLSAPKFGTLSRGCQPSAEPQVFPHLSSFLILIKVHCYLVDVRSGTTGLESVE